MKLTPVVKQRIGLYGGIFLMLIAINIGMRVYQARQPQGELVSPNAAFSAARVTHFRQDDNQWRFKTLGKSGDSMGRSGCLVTCIASALTAQGIETDPGALCEQMSAASAFSETGQVLWKPLETAVPGLALVVTLSRDDQLSSADIDGLLKKGILPMVKVKMRGDGGQHWVLITGSENGEYLTMDPLSDDELTPLSRHGKIYAWRTVVVN